jgi:hypothetical protein
LKYESNLLVPNFGELVAIKSFHRNSVEPVPSGSGPIQTSKEIHKCGFARAGNSHDGHERTAFHRERDTLQRMDGDFAQPISLGQVSRFDELRHGISYILGAVGADVVDEPLDALPLIDARTTACTPGRSWSERMAVYLPSESPNFTGTTVSCLPPVST